MWNNKKFQIGLNIILTIIIICLGFFIIKISTKENKKNIITHDNVGSFIFTNPILDCEINTQEEGLSIFSENVNKKVEKIKKDYLLSHISLYFRDLNNGPWIGINEKESFSPASLLKVPIMMEFLHEAEEDRSIFDKKIKILSSDIQSINQNVQPSVNLVEGEEYSLNEIVQLMIKKSDNTAVLALLRNIKKDNLGNIFRTVGVPYEDTNKEVEVRVKDYAGFFRILFNASYLNREMSEKALGILTQTEYYDGLVAGVPKEISVAHKFGERKIDGISNNSQLHDCGIIYYPGKPYILCIMTRGNNFVNQSKAIKDLSSFVYSEVNKNSK
jgi:beta-lactamase class A